MTTEHNRLPQKRTIQDPPHHANLSNPPPVNLPVVAQIQVTKNCNLNCSYCFQQHSGKIIDLSTVQSILDKVITHNLTVDPKNPNIQIYWHGGEPLLAGTDFFQKILLLEKNYPHIIFTNRVQTNGTLMDDRLARLFAENNFDVGFSIDGPTQIHDQYRLFSLSEKGTFQAAINGINCYRKYQPADKHIAVIAVITKKSIKRTRELYHFFKSIKADVQLDIYDLRTQDINPTCDNLSSTADLAPSPSEAGRFLIELFDLWFYDQDDAENRITIKELKQELKMILQPELDYGDPFHKKRCDFRRLIFSPDGLVFSCDQWVCDETSALGNIMTDPITSILEKKHQLWEQIKQVIRKSSQQMGCADCSWGRKCGGGCLTCMKYNSLLLQARAKGLPDSKWVDEKLPYQWSEMRNETYYCEGLRMLRQHIHKAVQAQGVFDAS